MFSALFQLEIPLATTSLWPIPLTTHYHEVPEQLFRGICDQYHANLETCELNRFLDIHFCAIGIG
jgi:hypothetical protein